MSGMLHADEKTGELVGWVVNTWSERGVEPSLLARMHWFPKNDGKLYHMQLNLTYPTTLEIFVEDTKIEARREAFIRVNAAVWETRYLDEKEK